MDSNPDFKFIGDDRGLVAWALEQIFMAFEQDKEFTSSLRIEFSQVYCDSIMDMLDPDTEFKISKINNLVENKEMGTHVWGMKVVEVKSL